MSQAGELNVVNNHPEIPTSFVTNSGTAVPIANELEILGTGSTFTTGVSNIVTVELTGLTDHAVLVGAGTTTITKVGPTSTAGQVLQSNGASADPSFSTAVYPSTTTINELLYSSAANNVTGLATADNGVLTTGTTGVPLITALAADGDLIIGSSSGAPAAATLTAGSGITITNAANSITIAASGGGGGITTITGDSGSVTGSSVSLLANSSSAHCGASVSFKASSSTELDLVLSDAFFNIFLGSGAGGTGLTFAANNAGLGQQCFPALTTGSHSIGIGQQAAEFLTTGSDHVSLGYQSNVGVTGSFNVVIGSGAGGNYGGSESYNILIASNGVANENNSIHIGGGTGTGAGQQNLCKMSGITGISVTGAAVLVSASDQLGVTVSSRKYKENIFAMGRESEAIYELIPSVFNYKHDPEKQEKFGLIAEEVADVLPQLVIYDSQGEPQSVAYHDLPVLLLNEIQKLRLEVDMLKQKVT